MAVISTCVVERGLESAIFNEMKTVFIVVVYKIQTTSLEFYEFALLRGRGRKTPCFNTILTSYYGETCFVRMSLVVESSPECMPHSLVNGFVFSLF